MYKLLSFFAILAVAFAAPAPEPGVAIISPAVYRTPLTYAPALGYAALPAAPLQYSASYIRAIPTAPIASIPTAPIASIPTAPIASIPTAPVAYKYY